jgi:hypothetical protein
MTIGKRAAGLTLGALLCVASTFTTASAFEPPQQERRTFVRNGDMVSASGKSDVLIRMRPRVKRVKTTTIDLGTRVKAKGITHSKFCEKIAIANSKNVIIYDVWTREIQVIEDERFGLIADVEYDMMCNLIIADMGRSSVGRWPRDGHIWRLSSMDGEIWEIGLRQNWVNPAFLDMDEWGTLYVLDKEAGPKMPRAGEWYFDAIYKSGAPNYQFAKAKYRHGGLTASAFAVHPDGRMFVGNEDDLVVIDNGLARSVCGPGTFSRVNGVDVNESLELYVVDGFDVFGATDLYRVDPGCDLTLMSSGSKIQGAQGLAIGLPSR